MKSETLSLTCFGWSEVRAMTRSSGRRWRRPSRAASTALEKSPICSPARMVTARDTALPERHWPEESR